MVLSLDSFHNKVFAIMDLASIYFLPRILGNTDLVTANSFTNLGVP